MALNRLFVRSKKTDIVIGSHHGSYYTRAHSQTKTEFTLLTQDAQAKDFLMKSGVDFDLVDLSKGAKARIVARIRGVRETPTLEVRQGSVKRYVGLKSISEYLSETRT